MHLPSLDALRSAYRANPTNGAIALLLLEDDTEIDSTLTHHLQLGFRRLILFCDARLRLPELPEDRVWRVDHDVSATGAPEAICNAMINAAPDTWLYYGFNAEYLYYPFCEHRSVTEMLTFMKEERRDTVVCATIDLYAQDLSQFPDGVDRANPYFDRSGYYALPRHDDAGQVVERQVDVFGGLRWRFEEHVPETRKRVDRTPLFFARKGLRMRPDRSFNIAEYNTYACPWHNNLSGAVASFRTAKALRRNPGSREQITTFHCPQSVAFAWQSQQLLDLGMMEPGQWF